MGRPDPVAPEALRMAGGWSESRPMRDGSRGALQDSKGGRLGVPARKG
jgi:hypothetical protein